MSVAGMIMVVVGFVLTVVAVGELSSRRGWNRPLALILVGSVLGLIPGLQVEHLSPDLTFYVLMPPLLYSAALATSLIDIRKHLRPILSLSFLLVLFTAFGVAIVVTAIIPVPFPVALALGAIVAPPDAVAATAVARQVGMPRRVTTILGAESLLNDASALVTMRTALAAAGLTTYGFTRHSGSTIDAAWVVALDFVVAAAGGVLFGFVTYALMSWARRRVSSVRADTALGFVMPFLAYVPAEELGTSGVLAVVTAGLLAARSSPSVQNARSRLTEQANWRSLNYALENSVFLLIGLQVYTLWQQADDAKVSLARTVGLAIAVLVAVLVLRPIWMLPASWISSRGKPMAVRRDQLQDAALGSWAGMRGVVTVASALTLPTNTPARAQLILAALTVTVGTLAIQGLTLPWVVRRLHLRGPDPRKDTLQGAAVLGKATEEAHEQLAAEPDVDPEALADVYAQATSVVDTTWERVTKMHDPDAQSPGLTRARLRARMLILEREALLRIRDADNVDDDVIRELLLQIDLQEAAIHPRTRTGRTHRTSTLRTPSVLPSPCKHLRAPMTLPKAQTPKGCAECLKLGWDWVELRLCEDCGHVGCCDSSRGQHAAAHYTKTTHPVMRSYEEDEAWRWCYIDELLG